MQASSSLKQSNKIYGAGIGVHNSVPQYAGSDTVQFYGHIYVDINPTTIQLMPGSSMSAAVGAPGDGDTGPLPAESASL